MVIKLTADEERRVLGMRAAKALEEQRRKQEQERWEAEQKRLDTPGLGCLDCDKTERQVVTEGKYDENTRLDGYGVLTLSQWTSGGGMAPRAFSVRFSARLCCECLKRRVEELERVAR